MIVRFKKKRYCKGYFHFEIIGVRLKHISDYRRKLIYMLREVLPLFMANFLSWWLLIDIRQQISKMFNYCISQFIRTLKVSVWQRVKLTGSLQLTHTHKTRTFSHRPRRILEGIIDLCGDSYCRAGQDLDIYIYSKFLSSEYWDLYNLRVDVYMMKRIGVFLVPD